MYTYATAIFVVNVKLATRFHSFTWIHNVTLWGISLGAFLLFNLVVNNLIWTPELQGVTLTVYDNVSFWLILLLAPIAACFPDVTWHAFRVQQNPKDCEVIFEVERGWMTGSYSKDKEGYVGPTLVHPFERRKSTITFVDQHGGITAQLEEAVAKRISFSAPSEAKVRTTNLIESSKSDASSELPAAPKVKKLSMEGKVRPMKRRMTWRQLVQEDEDTDGAELADGSNDHVGALVDGRRRSSGFIVTSHGDSSLPASPTSTSPSFGISSKKEVEVDLGKSKVDPSSSISQGKRKLSATTPFSTLPNSVIANAPNVVLTASTSSVGTTYSSSSTSSSSYLDSTSVRSPLSTQSISSIPLATIQVSLANLTTPAINPQSFLTPSSSGETQTSSKSKTITFDLKPSIPTPASIAQSSSTPILETQSSASKVSSVSLTTTPTKSASGRYKSRSTVMLDTSEHKK